MKDNRPDHDPILPGVMSERAVRSTLNAVTKMIRKAKGSSVLLKLRGEQKQLQIQLQEVIELKRRKLEARLAQLEAAIEQEI